MFYVSEFPESFQNFYSLSEFYVATILSILLLHTHKQINIQALICTQHYKHALHVCKK